MIRGPTSKVFPLKFDRLSTIQNAVAKSFNWELNSFALARDNAILALTDLTIEDEILEVVTSGTEGPTPGYTPPKEIQVFLKMEGRNTLILPFDQVTPITIVVAKFMDIAVGSFWLQRILIRLHGQETISEEQHLVVMVGSGGLAGGVGSLLPQVDDAKEDGNKSTTDEKSGTPAKGKERTDMDDDPGNHSNQTNTETAPATTDLTEWTTVGARGRPIRKKRACRDKGKQRHGEDEERKTKDRRVTHIDDEDKQWLVEAIVGVTEEGNFRVKWSGFNARCNTWEPCKNFELNNITVDAFYDRQTTSCFMTEATSRRREAREATRLRKLKARAEEKELLRLQREGLLPDCSE